MDETQIIGNISNTISQKYHNKISHLYKLQNMNLMNETMNSETKSNKRKKWSGILVKGPTHIQKYLKKG